jgi:protein-L-isoaspartate(D-aspartate) O-methyltransferase
LASATTLSDDAARRAMIDSQLKPCGIVHPRTVAAFAAVDRSRFVPSGRRRLAYVDAAHPLPGGRELMAPLSLGLLVEAAQARAGDRVLIIGAGTGYSAAILSRLAGSVVALESDPDLAAQARENCADLASVRVEEGPLDQGWPEGAPYDLILIDGGVETLPDPLVAQLAEGGRLLAIVRGSDGVTRAARGIRHAGHLRPEPFAEAVASILPAFGKAPAFRF